ncbi:hypothetical protein Ndes2526A_g04026 [Nannochloris sp. 'desiccata']
MLGTELLKCSPEKIEEYLSEVHPVFTQVYTGPDAQMPDEATFEACGRDARRCQVVCIRNAIKTLKGDSTLKAYVDCLRSGWIETIDARNKEPKHINDQWDYLAHPMSKYGVPYNKLELRNHILVGLARETLVGEKRKRSADPGQDIAKRARARYFTDAELGRYFDWCIENKDHNAAASLGCLLATGLRKAQIPQMQLAGCWIEEIEHTKPCKAKGVLIAFVDGIKDTTRQGKLKVTAIFPGRDALQCAVGFLAEKFIADRHSGNHLDLADLVLNQPDVFSRVQFMYQDASSPDVSDEGGEIMFQAVKNAEKKSGTYKEGFVTKVGRSTAAQNAAMSGVSLDLIAYHQGWSRGNAMDTNYLKKNVMTSLPCYLTEDQSRPQTGEYGNQDEMSNSMDFLRRSLGLGRRLTTAAQAAPARVEQASLAASDLKGKLLEDVNKIIKETPSLRYIWAVGGGIIVVGSALFNKIHNVEAKIHNVEVQVERVEKGLNEKIHNVEVQVERVEKGLNEKIHSLEVKLKGELHDQLGQIRGELSNNLSSMRASMERSEDKLSAQIEKTNETLAQLLKKLP